MAKPWWQFPRIDNLGSYPDPAGNYYKPDSNIQVPAGYPIVAIAPGTVTSVQYTSWGMYVVTVQLDNPINSMATYQFYEHMNDATVSEGQHIVQGTLIGHNALSGPPLGFGFYSGPVYGQGSAWQTLQNDLAANGNSSLLSPVAYLDNLAGIPYSGGSTITSGTGGSTITSGTGGSGLSTSLLSSAAIVPIALGLGVVVGLGLLVYFVAKEA